MLDHTLSLPSRWSAAFYRRRYYYNDPHVFSTLSLVYFLHMINKYRKVSYENENIYNRKKLHNISYIHTWYIHTNQSLYKVLNMIVIKTMTNLKGISINLKCPIQCIIL